MVSFKSLYQSDVQVAAAQLNGTSQTNVATTTSIADGAFEDIDLTIGKSYLLCCIETDVDGLVRVYGSSAGRTADVRAAGVPPSGTEEALIAEVDTSGGNLRIDLSPSVVAVNSDSPQEDIAYLRIYNQSGGPSVVNATLYTTITGAATTAMARAEATYLGAPQPISTGGFVVWDTEVIDTGTMVDVGGGTPERITIDQDGRYAINTTIQFSIASHVGTETVVAIALNGTTFLAAQKFPVTTTNPIISVSAIADLVATDYLTVDVIHDDGGTIDAIFVAGNDFPKISVIQIPAAEGGAGGSGGGGGAPGEVTTAVTSTGSNVIVLETDPEFHFVTPSANITFSVPATPSLDRRYVVKHEGGANTIDVDDGTTSFGILNAGQDIAVIFSTVDSSWRVE